MSTNDILWLITRRMYGQFSSRLRDRRGDRRSDRRHHRAALGPRHAPDHQRHDQRYDRGRTARRRRPRARAVVRFSLAPHFMNAEIIAIGSELLLGATVDTNR